MSKFINTELQSESDSDSDLVLEYGTESKLELESDFE